MEICREILFRSAGLDAIVTKIRSTAHGLVRRVETPAGESARPFQRCESAAIIHIKF